MVLSVPIFAQGGQLLPAGSKITDRHLRQLRSWGIEAFDTAADLASFADVARATGGEEAEVLDVEALGLAPKPQAYRPPGRETDGGATWLVEGSVAAVAEPIRIDSNLVVTGDVAAGARLEVKGSCRVEGNVAEGARITAGTELVVGGSIIGRKSKPVVLQAESITVAAAEQTWLTASKNVTAEVLRECSARAEGDVVVTGAEEGIVGGRVEAGGFIRASQVEGLPDQPAVLCVFLQRQKQLFMAATSLARAIEEKTAEVSKLEKVIEVIRLLGEKVVSLPPEKKQELALQSKRYMELKAEIADLERKLARIQDEMEVEIPPMDSCPVRIERIRPALEILIGSSQLKLNARQGATGYYLKGGRVMAVSH